MGASVCLGEGVTQSGVECIVWQRGLRILHYCHLGSNSQCWSNCQLNSKSNSSKWSPSLKYSVSLWRLAYTILLRHNQWRVVFLCLTYMCSNLVDYLSSACHFLRMKHFEARFTSLFRRSNYIFIHGYINQVWVFLFYICLKYRDFNKITFISTVYFNK